VITESQSDLKAEAEDEELSSGDESVRSRRGSSFSEDGDLSPALPKKKKKPLSKAKSEVLPRDDEKSPDLKKHSSSMKKKHTHLKEESSETDPSEEGSKLKKKKASVSKKPAQPLASLEPVQIRALVKIQAMVRRFLVVRLLEKKSEVSFLPSSFCPSSHAFSKAKAIRS